MLIFTETSKPRHIYTFNSFRSNGSIALIYPISTWSAPLITKFWLRPYLTNRTTDKEIILVYLFTGSFSSQFIQLAQPSLNTMNYATKNSYMQDSREEPVTANANSVTRSCKSSGWLSRSSPTFPSPRVIFCGETYSIGFAAVIYKLGSLCLLTLQAHSNRLLPAGCSNCMVRYQHMCSENQDGF